MLPAERFFDAARRGDPSEMRRALGELTAFLGPAIRRTLIRHDRLVRRCRLEPEDVVQRVFEQLLASPPNNPQALDPPAVLGAWARAVAFNYLFDLSKRLAREGEEPDEDLRTVDRPQEREHEAREQWRRARECADNELSRHKHLRELFYAVAEDPELSAKELARKIGLLSDDAAAADAETVRRAEQYVWKLRQRVQEKLADHLEQRGRRP